MTWNTHLGSNKWKWTDHQKRIMFGVGWVRGGGGGQNGNPFRGGPLENRECRAILSLGITVSNSTTFLANSLY